MLHKIRELPGHQAARFRAVVSARIRFSDCRYVEYAAGLGVFHPVQGFACVFEAPNTLHVFVPTIECTSARNRARTFAALLFAQLVEKRQDQATD